jgi:hypothetical protein
MIESCLWLRCLSRRFRFQFVENLGVNFGHVFGTACRIGTPSSELSVQLVLLSCLLNYIQESEIRSVLG